jgi:hypothetical protein
VTSGDLATDTAWHSVDYGVRAMLAFETPVGYATARSAAVSPLELERVDTSGTGSTLDIDVEGDPVAGVGLPDGMAILLSSTDGKLLLWRLQAGHFLTITLETTTCARASGFALGALGRDLVAAYSCQNSVTDPTTEGPSRQLVIARVAAGGVEVERTALDVEAFGEPAATWLGDEFLFAYATSDGASALAYAAPGSTTSRVVPVTGGAAPAALNDDTPVYSVAAADGPVFFTRSTCYRHEDAASTGSVAFCRVEDDSGNASCSEVDSPCSAARLAPTSQGLLLLPCGGLAAPALVAVDPSAPPAPLDAFFPRGYANLAPRGLVCDDTTCSALVETDSSEPTTGYDQRLAIAEVDLGPECEGRVCRAGAFGLTEVRSLSPHDLEPGGLEVEEAPIALPVGVVSAVHDGLDLRPLLSLVGEEGVVYGRELPVPPFAVFRTDTGFRALSPTFISAGLEQTEVTADGVEDEPLLPMWTAADTPAFARCGERVIFHAAEAFADVAQGPWSLLALDLQTSEFGPLFDVGIAPAQPGQQSLLIGCTENHVFMLDGDRVHGWTLDGTRQPDIDLGPLAPSVSRSDPIFVELVSRGDHVLLARASSGADAIDALFLADDGSTRAVSLPLPELVVPPKTVRFASDRGDGWLRASYQGARGDVYVSAWRIDGAP